MSEEELKARKREELARAFINEIVSKTFEGISQLSEDAEETVLRSTCRGCAGRVLAFMAHNYGYDPEKPDLDAYMAADEKLEKLLAHGQASRTREGNIINAVSKAGECMCPLVRDYKIIQPYPNLCICSKNFMKVQYEAAARRPVKVDVIESYNRGGNCCHFRIELL